MLLATFDPLCVAPSPSEGRNCVMSTSQRLLGLVQGFFDDQPCLGPSHRPLRIAGRLPYYRREFRGRPCKHQCPDEFTDGKDEMGILWWPFQRRSRERAARRASDTTAKSSSPSKKSKKEDCSCPDTTAANSTDSCTAADKVPCGYGSSPADPAASAAGESDRSSAVCPSRGSTPWTLRVPLGGMPEPQDLRVWTRDGVLIVTAHIRGGESGRATFVRHIVTLPSHVAPEALASRLSRDGVLTVTCTRVPDGPRDVPVTPESGEPQEQEDGTRADQSETTSRVQPGDGETRVGLGSQSTGDGSGSQSNSNADNDDSSRERGDDATDGTDNRRKSSQSDP